VCSRRINDLVELLRQKDAVGMSEPRYSFHSDSQALHVIAENTRRSADALEKIRSILLTTVSVAIGLIVGYQVRQEGWRSLFGGWL
jgi:hypothetical protein